MKGGARTSSLKLFGRGAATGEPILFAGDASMLKGDLWLQNEQSEELRLKRATVVSPAMEKHSATAEVARISLPAVVASQHRKLVSASFDIDPTTPPGTYEAQIQIETAQSTITYPARIIVAQHYQLSLEPDEFVFTAAPGASVSGALVVRNEGNVVVYVTRIGEVELKDPEQEECCPKCGSREPSEEDFGALIISNEAVQVQPGTSALVEFTAKLPDSLPGNEQLRATPRIGNERFTIDIITPPGRHREKRSSSSKRK